MKKKITLCLTVLTLMFNCAGAYSEDLVDEHSELFKTVAVKDGTSLNIVNCVALAFKNSPIIKKKKYALDVAKSNAGIAKSVFFPVIGAKAGFHNENNSNNDAYHRYYRELPNVAVTVNQLVWDFGKSTANIKMEEFYKIGAEYEFMDSLCTTLFDVKEKYYELLKAQALVDIAEDNVKICQKYLKNARGIPDKLMAELQLSNAECDFNLAKTHLRNAKVNLSNAMYINNTPEYNILKTKTFAYDNDYRYENRRIPPDFVPQKINIPEDKRIEIAYENSPDIKVLEATRDAMEQSLKFVKRKYFPELTAGVGYGYNNSTEASNNSLQVGVNLSSNVNLMELKHSIKGADAQLKSADNEIVRFKEDLTYKIQRAFNMLDFVTKDIPGEQEAAIMAIKSINKVESLYNEGVLNYVALHDARKEYILAMRNYVNSLFLYNKSLIEIEEALHYHIVDIHHKSQHAVLSHSDELIEHLNEALECDESEKKKTKRFKKSKHNL